MHTFDYGISQIEIPDFLTSEKPEKSFVSFSQYNALLNSYTVLILCHDVLDDDFLRVTITEKASEVEKLFQSYIRPKKIY